MAEPARKKATYEDLYAIPENAVGEIIEGDLYAHPRPAAAHIYAASALGGKLAPPYQFGDRGPGGWIILVEPEIGLEGNVLVPDLAGWKRERFAVRADVNWIGVAPDWICEILSPSTARVDMIRKMPIYARHEVRYAWIIDPAIKVLDAFRLESGTWLPIGSYSGNDPVRAEPFQELEINLADLWLENDLGQSFQH
jgi:Uma2 family endonuclease